MSDTNLYYQRMPLTTDVNPRILTDTVRQRACIGRSHWRSSFAMIPNSMPYKKPILGYCLRMEEYEPLGLGWILYGKLGSGKTTLATLILKYCLAKGGRALSFNASDLLDKLSLFSPPPVPCGASLHEALAKVNYLLIDDLQEEDVKRLKKLEIVLRARYADLFPTVITTNMSKEQVFELPWLKDIINDRYEGAEIAGINWRKSPPNGSTRSLL